MQAVNSSCWGHQSLSYNYLENLIEQEKSSSWVHSAVVLHGIGSLAMFDALLIDACANIAYSIYLLVAKIFSDAHNEESAIYHMVKAGECLLKAAPVFVSTLLFSPDDVKNIFFKDKILEEQAQMQKLDVKAMQQNLKQVGSLVSEHAREYSLLKQAHLLQEAEIEQNSLNLKEYALSIIELAKDNEDLITEIRVLEATLQAQEDLLEQQHEEADGYHDKLNESLQKVQSLAEELAHYKGAKLEEANEILKNRISLLQGHLENTTRNYQTLLEGDAVAESVELRKQNSQLHIQIGNLERQLTEKEEKIKCLRQQKIGELYAKTKSLSKERHILKEENVKLTQKNQEVLQENDRLKKDLDHTKTIQQTQHRLKVAHHKRKSSVETRGMENIESHLNVIRGINSKTGLLQKGIHVRTVR